MTKGDPLRSSLRTFAVAIRKEMPSDPWSARLKNTGLELLRAGFAARRGEPVCE